MRIVSFHAHPDDEALLTGGTLAAAAAAGHHVVLVVATRGDAGLAGAADGTGDDLARRRMDELAASAEILGCAEVRWLGYADSGLAGDETREDAFVRASVESAGARLAAILREVGADVLTGYDANGGYGHPDHRQAHRVARRAAALAGTPRLLEATLPATAFRAGIAMLAAVRDPLGRAPVATRSVFAATADITHVAVLDPAALDAKRRAIAAHASQSRGVEGRRLIDRLNALPRPVARALLGREWFVDVGAPGPRRPLLPLAMSPIS